MNTLLLSSKPLVDGNGTSLSDGGIISILAVCLVFTILAIIIGITFFAGKTIEKFSIKKETITQPITKEVVDSDNKIDVNLDDEDAVVALLVASIDYRNEIKKDFKVKSIKEIK